MRLTGMDIKDTPPFTELVELDFDARVNVFIGPNASGKSVLLREIDAAFNMVERPRPSFRIRDEPRYRSMTPFVSVASRKDHRSWDKTSGDYFKTLIFTGEDSDDPDSPIVDSSKPPVVYIGPVRPTLPELYDEADSSDDEVDIGEILSRPFSGANFEIANEKMYQLVDHMYDQQQEDDTLEPRAHRIFEFTEKIYPHVNAICAEVVTGNELRNYVTGLSMENLDYQPLANFDEVNIHRALGFNTIDTPNFVIVRPDDRPSYSDSIGKAPLYAGFLSSGTQTTFLWIYWLAYKMLHHYDFAEGWQNEPAILLIDEIENHLHPTWQRRVIPELLKCFPNLQIFATTHSPFVVAGLRSGQVHLLRRNSDGVVESSTNDHDIIGWTTDEILRTFMGVDEPTDELTIRRSRRLRELRGKESLTDKERDELETLRRQVNADLLSSKSPMEAQRGRYADMMLRFIESRQSELSQDG